MNSTRYRNQLEPSALIRQFAAHPPEGFVVDERWPAPAFTAPFDLLTTADEALKRKLQKLPCGPWLARRLTLDTDFVGTTLTEYAPMPQGIPASRLAAQLREHAGGRMLTIVKDLPQSSPLLGADDNAFSDALVQQLVQMGFILVEGQALAYVPIDFTSIDEYLARLSKGRRQNLKRKLKSLAHLQIARIATGEHFASDMRVSEYYALFDAVYAQSEIHFDKLTPAFFAAILRDASNGGIVFEYRSAADGALLGWNLCFEHQGRLIDKYIGLSYPRAREMNLYFVSWMINLEYAIERGITHYVAGWTDPEVKAQLGARFTFTRHAVFIRNRLLRALGRRFSGRFESDRQWSEEHLT
ncbi:GNAT family N-acetyltransferase [Diaphorobacter aerolatus]|uniref:GNAT family N-acetyltransferase n=1 Tax=Diaphorobacter aerolatus TaxID=1288495 RepID=A0A7H0GFZ2_9BURK|nr:GNAT family N-acetyltransferase [Diaphorobacter aerolatus]QNP47208.1 GNAT family N-acetyltransferase [Diaphorobacter aerolatus]